MHTFVSSSSASSEYSFEPESTISDDNERASRNSSIFEASDKSAGKFSALAYKLERKN